MTVSSDKTSKLSVMISIYNLAWLIISIFNMAWLTMKFSQINSMSLLIEDSHISQAA